MRHALIALGMGGPDSVEAIRPFLRNLFSDREIIDFGIGNFPQKVLANIIAYKRAKRIAPSYLEMGFGGGSPQNYYTKKLLENIKPIYEAQTGATLDTYSAMCYYHPFIHDTVEQVLKNDYDKIYLLPLYPHYSMTTTGACFSKLEKALKGREFKGEVVKITDWYKAEKYNDCIKSRILAASEKLGKAVADCHVVFSAHSIPVMYVEKGDKYVSQVEQHVENIVKITGIKKFTLAYQSKVGKMEWVKPATDETIESLAHNGVSDIIVVPIAFISDHIETLIELDKELIPEIVAEGVSIVRADSLNDDNDFVESVVDILIHEEV